MKSISLRAAGLGLATLAAAGGVVWLIATQGPLAPVEVTLATAREQPLALELFGIGTVEARRSYAIGPTAPGRLARVLVDQGDRVEAGQLLAEMDPVDLGYRVEAARAAAERAAHAERAAQASLAEAASRARMAQASEARYADLRGRNFVSEEALEAKRHESAAAAAARDAAAAALAAAQDDARRAQAEQRAVTEARTHLQLKSPVAGVVSARLSEPGSTLVAGQSVLQLVDPASLWVRTRLDQGRSAGLAPGLAADITLRSRPGVVLRGKVQRVDLLGDAVAEERLAHVGFGETPPGLTIGELAEVTIRLPAMERTLTIPAAAVKRGGGGDAVWVLADGLTALRPVAVGAGSLDGAVQVISGLQPGETVVVHSSKALVPGLRVRAREALARAP